MDRLKAIKKKVIKAQKSDTPDLDKLQQLKDKLQKYQNQIEKSPRTDAEKPSPSGATTPDATAEPKRTAEDKVKEKEIKVKVELDAPSIELTS